MKLFVNKIEDYTNGKVKLVIICNTHKIQSLFSCKDKIQHHSCEIYCSVSSCGTDYIVETIRISKICWKKHSTGRDENCGCVENFNDNFVHEF